MTAIMSTTDYSLFKKHEGNRTIDEGNLRKIIYSMQTQNLLHYRPILVDTEMKVIDGQHRLEAAKKLGLPVFYQIDDSGEEQNILLLNTNQKNWSSTDYLNYYISKGNIHYIKIKDFCNKNSLTIGQYLKICSFNMRHPWILFKSGMLKHIAEEEEMKQNSIIGKMTEITAIIEQYTLTDISFIKATRFKSALISFLRVPNLDFATFKAKLVHKSEAVRPCISMAAYFNMFKLIYNWKNQNPIE